MVRGILLKAILGNNDDTEYHEELRDGCEMCGESFKNQIIENGTL